jgi:hypothetical protein
VRMNQSAISSQPGLEATDERNPRGGECAMQTDLKSRGRNLKRGTANVVSTASGHPPGRRASLSLFKEGL